MWTLLASIQTLPQVHNSKYHGIHRGSHLSRHYCIWCPYAKQPFVSTEFHKDGEGAKEFMNRNSDLYTRMSEVLEAIFPSVSRAYQKYPIPAGLTRMAGAFMGCVVNIGSAETPVETEPHRDVKESVFGVSCLCPFGDYSQGGIILWELEMVIELAAGDLLFFPDSLIHHSI